MASLKFNNVYMEAYATVAGPYEEKGQIKNYDITFNDLDYNTKSFEDAEVKMQQKAFETCLAKTKKNINDITVAIGGDLLNQLTTSAMSAKKYNIPFLGVYSACATFTESLLLLANLIDKSNIKRGTTFISGHNLTSERQFRYPVEYGSPKVQTTTFTATGAVSTILSSEVSNIKIESATIGKIIDYGIKDVFNMGAVMAPSAVDVLHDHLTEMGRTLDYYDVILTGDLGEVGTKLFRDVYKILYGKNIKNHLDAGTLIYKKSQELFSGASGPAVLPLVLCTKFLQNSKYKKILIIGTGSLHSPTLVNQKHSIPSISHAVSLEVK